ncbi:MAG: hypothetical protein L6V87_11745 [Ruminococcus sp.]|nr:MAG: hypothetical protein L6V87_11745 [Ruminococcus sp.]
MKRCLSVFAPFATFVSCKFISYKTEPLYTIPDEPSFWIYIFQLTVYLCDAGAVLAHIPA